MNKGTFMVIVLISDIDFSEKLPNFDMNDFAASSESKISSMLILHCKI